MVSAREGKEIGICPGIASGFCLQTTQGAFGARSSQHVLTSLGARRATCLKTTKYTKYTKADQTRNNPRRSGFRVFRVFRGCSTGRLILKTLLRRDDSLLAA